MAKALEASGFTVIKRENATLREMHLALREFGDRLDRQGSGVFYFAGHGMQVRGRNYLIPVDADIAREDEVAFAALDLGAVMEKLDSAKNPVNIVILDACRNNPFGTRVQASAKGLAQVEAPPGTLIAFATAPGSTAADGGSRNGLYTGHLVKQIDRPGLAIEEVFKAVRASVRADSKNTQIPWESTSLESAFSFRRRPAEPRLAAAQPPPAKASPPRAALASATAPPAFKAGNSWIYRHTNLLDQAERTYTIRVKEIRGDEVVYANGNLGDLVGNLTRIHRRDGKIELWNPSNAYYTYPLKVGNKWEVDAVEEIGDRTYDVRVRVAVVAEEQIETAVGKLRALKITREAHWKRRGKGDDAGVNVWTYWYNGGVGRFVLGESSNTTAKGKILFRERHELASYDLK